MPHVTCHRKNYKLLDPHVWEVFGGEHGTEHQGYYNGITKTSCDPPRYVLTAKDPENVTSVSYTHLTLPTNREV